MHYLVLIFIRILETEIKKGSKKKNIKDFIDLLKIETIKRGDSLYSIEEIKVL